MKLINCTPHDVVLVYADGTHRATIPPCGIVPRIPLRTTLAATIDVDGAGPVHVNAPVVDGPVSPLPDPVPGTLYVVSRAVAEAVPDRPDLVYPDDTVRDDRGRIIGCRAFGIAARYVTPGMWMRDLARLWAEVAEEASLSVAGAEGVEYPAPGDLEEAAP